MQRKWTPRTSRISRNPVAWRTAMLISGAMLGYMIAGAQATSPPTLLFHRLLGSHTSRGVSEESSVDYGEENEHHVDAVTMDTTVAVIVIFLIVLTIFFEYLKEFIEEAADRTMKPVIQGLFGELTVLGFLSMVTFLMAQLGWFSTASEYLFGHADDEELFETFEFVHFMLFFIMVFFVINVLILVRGGQATEDTWWTYNAACRDQKYMAQLDSISPRRLHQTTYLKYLFQTCFPCWSTKNRLRLELQLFRGLRQEFVLERSADPPFAPNANSLVDDKWNFGRYLSICLGYQLLHMVHVTSYTWAFLGVLTLIFYGIALGVENSMEDFAWIWAGFGWLVFLLGNYFDYHMVSLLENMAGGHTTATNEKGGGKSDSLLESGLPAWTRIDLERYLGKGRPLLAQWCLRSKMTVTRQDSMYWMERKGPKLYLVLFQIQMVFTAAYVSLLIMSSFPFMFTESMASNFERWSYVVISLLPVFLLFSKYHTAAANLTMACSIGVHRRPQAVSQVIRESKTDRIIRALVLLQKLQRAALDGSFAVPAAHPEQSPASGSWSPSAVTAEEVEEVTTTFDALDHSGDGYIRSKELGKVLQSLGAKATEESLSAMVAVLDSNKDGNISRDEFLDFYKKHMVFDLDRDGLHELARHMFEQFDSDGNGVITLSEFKNVLDSLNVDFSIDEIGDLVNELDEQHGGTIAEHQFVELLKKHDHLFEQRKLPKLE